MLSSRVHVHKYMDVRACPLRADHSQQLAEEKASQMCECGQVRGLGSLHFLHPQTSPRRASVPPAVNVSSLCPGHVWTRLSPLSLEGGKRKESRIRLPRRKEKNHLEICTQTFRTDLNTERTIFVVRVSMRDVEFCSCLPWESKSHTQG